MTKAELVNAIAIQTGYDRVTILKIVDSMMDQIKQTMSDGENVFLRGFGTFQIKTRKTKVARNITKNTSIIVPEHNIPVFKSANDFNAMMKTPEELAKIRSSKKD